MTEKEALIALNMIPEIGSQRLKNLINECGSAGKIFISSKERLKRVENIGDKISQEIAAFKFESLALEFKLAQNSGIKIITLEDKDYPENLKNIYDPPVCLYVLGNLSNRDNFALAVVGSRRASFYGLSQAEKFSSQLAEQGVTVISGLARGIDTQAHKGALKAGGRTIAVLGSGINNIYPYENKGLAEKIAGSGALVSEFPLNAGPRPQNFPRRNRVISGLSCGVVVVEAARNSGALITADFALEQGREVFALPGKVDCRTSYGANQLIKDGAKLVSCIEDIMEEYVPAAKTLADRPQNKITGQKSKPQSAPLQGSKTERHPALAEDENKIYGLLDKGGRQADELIEASGLESGKVMSMLLSLQMQKLVKQLPGNIFVKI